MRAIDAIAPARPWRRDRPLLQIGACALLAAVLCARYPQGVLAPAPLPDELAYVTAAERVAAGQGPYYGPYFYPPALAYAGAGLIWVAGHDGLLLAIRAFNVLGVVLLVWWSIALLRWPLGWRLIAAASYLLVSPPVAYGILWGNLSLGIAAMILLGLLIWPVQPVFAGVLLGLSIAAKPLALVAVLVVGLQRLPISTDRPGLQRAHWRAAAIAGALACGLLLGPPHLREFLSLSGRLPPFTRNVALHRVLHCFGVELPPWALCALVAILAVLWTRRRARSPWQVLIIAIPTTLLALPLVWSHTLLLTLPLQVVAMERAWRSWRGSKLADRPLKRLEAILVLGAVLAVELSQGVGGIDDRAFWLQGLVSLLPALAPVALGLYLLRPGSVEAC